MQRSLESSSTSRRGKPQSCRNTSTLRFIAKIFAVTTLLLCICSGSARRIDVEHVHDSQAAAFGNAFGETQTAGWPAFSNSSASQQGSSSRQLVLQAAGGDARGRVAHVMNLGGWSRSAVGSCPLFSVNDGSDYGCRGRGA